MAEPAQADGPQAEAQTGTGGETTTYDYYYPSYTETEQEQRVERGPTLRGAGTIVSAGPWEEYILVTGSQDGTARNDDRRAGMVREREITVRIEGAEVRFYSRDSYDSLFEEGMAVGVVYHREGNEIVIESLEPLLS
jgi:hypothetical protein